MRWIAGSPSAKHNTDPDIQVYAYDPHTVILRQNKAVHYEAPFLYLLFGNERAMLLDTGATESARYFPLRSTVDGLIERWLDDVEARFGPLTIIQPERKPATRSAFDNPLKVRVKTSGASRANGMCTASS